MLNFKKYTDRIPSFLKNKYIIPLIILLIWVTFFDSNNFIKQYQLRQELESLNQKKSFYKSEIKKDSTSLHDLSNNSETREKFAREQYLMKKENEDVIIIIEADE